MVIGGVLNIGIFLRVAGDSLVTLMGIPPEYLKLTMTVLFMIVLNRAIVLSLGGFLVIYGLWYQIPGRTWDYLAITGNIYTANISVLLVACCYFKGANKTGAFATLIGGALVPLVFLFTGFIKDVQTAGLACFGWLPPE